jgi:photosystem II stability/assembly factor-like uncharacterized protein
MRQVKQRGSRFCDSDVPVRCQPTRHPTFGWLMLVCLVLTGCTQGTPDAPHRVAQVAVPTENPTAVVSPLPATIPVRPSATRIPRTPTPLPSPVPSMTYLTRSALLDQTHLWLALLETPSQINRLIRTTNAGSVWQEVFQTQHFIQALQFIDVQHGWMILREERLDTTSLLATADGGVTWQTISTESPMSTLTMTSVTHGFMLKRGVMYETTDGGARWTTPNPDLYVEPILVFDEHHVRSISVSTHDVALRTADGGHSWVPIDQPACNWYRQTYSMQFTDAAHGWLYCYEKFSEIDRTPRWYRTVDGEAHWEEFTPMNTVTAMPFNLTSFFFLDANTGWSFAAASTAEASIEPVSPNSAHPTLFQTHDGGETWSPKGPIGGGVGGELTFLDPVVGFSHTYTGLWQTTDGGETWSQIYSY